MSIGCKQPSFYDQSVNNLLQKIKLYFLSKMQLIPVYSFTNFFTHFPPPPSALKK